MGLWHKTVLFACLCGVCLGNARAQPLTSEEAVQRGHCQSHELRVSRADAAAARAVYRQARAGRLPAVSSQASYMRLSDNIPEITVDYPEVPGQETTEYTLASAAGRVLAVHHESAGMVSPGEPLVEVGDTRALEVRVDVLSQDAVRLTPGTRVLFEQWGGDEQHEGVVERVDPQGFTQVSSLGVEEQRVTVVADLTSPAGVWAGTGVGYRVLARFVVWEGQNVLQVPASALFRTEEG